MNVSIEMATFQARYQRTIVDRLGNGVDGSVFATAQSTAIKLYTATLRYQREKEVYLHLQAIKLDQVAGHAIPKLIRFDDELRAIEMTIVRPPFILDFAAAKTDEEWQRLTIDDESMEENYIARTEEKYGERAADALAVADAFARATGWVLFDLHPGNLRFA